MKKILIIIIISLFVFPQITEAYCSCYNRKYFATPVGEKIKEEIGADKCDQECANRKTKYYCLKDVCASYDIVSVTKTPITAQPITPTIKNSTGKYTPMEEIPGFGRPADFPQYLMAIYKFGLWAIGLSAMFMIMIGGYMYITSAGNNSQTGKAKGIITDAIAGLILALISYVLLYTINPELVQFKPLKGITSTSSSSSSTTSGTSNGSTGGTIAQNYAKACPAGDTVAKIADFSKAPNDPKIVVDSNCAKLIPSSVDGVSAKILQTIAQIESTCGVKKGESPAKCCGLMQLAPATASTLNGSPVTCAQLIADDALSIRLSAKYLKQSGYLNDSEKLFAGYNSGYGKNLTSDGKKPALADSSDCPGSNAFECCKNPGELKETISYVWNATGLMSK